VWVTRDVASVAMWDAPHPTPPATSVTRRIWREFDSLANTRVKARLAAYNDAIKRASPRHPFWYLGVLATHPAHQQRGLANAVLTPVLQQADADRLPCCLETSTEANRRFYERRGFEPDQEITIAGGPQTWWMQRSPNTDRAEPLARPR
jgi:GNAT superfamily N-acetyltransferase